jgi:DNA-binding transcriptional LysR family regulator
VHFVELRQMRYFVAVAEELHFTRAAQRLHIAQQPLSSAIARLEAQLGVTLLDRTTRRVELTEPGRAFLEAARTALAAADAAVETALVAAGGSVGEVSLGVSSGAWYGLGELFEHLRTTYPNVRLDVRQQSGGPAVGAIRRGELDLAVGLCVPAQEGLEMHRLKDEPVVAVLAAAHPLSDRASLALAELERETFALDDPADGAGYNAAVLGLCEQAGFAPRIAEVQTHHDAWERLIASGRAVGLTTACSLHASHPGVRAIALDPAATFPLDLIVRSAGDAPSRPVVRVVAEAAIRTADRMAWRAL